MKILFFGKKGDTNAEEAGEYTKLIFPDTQFVWGARGDKFPDNLEDWEGDYIFSYLSQWVIPQRLLDKAKNGGINWHPGPPEYPGIGCTNFAIYNNESVYGITCHFMKAKVDTGSVVEIRRFNVLKDDNVLSITKKCYVQILASYYSILEKISLGEELPSSKENWTRQPYTRKELQALCRIEEGTGVEEIRKRIRATKYDKHWAYLEIDGMKFHYQED